MVQLENDGIIEVFNLACRKVHDAHNAANIKRWVREILNEFSIKDESVLAFTADSAANIQKAAKLFLDELQGNTFIVGCERFDADEEGGDENDRNVTNLLASDSNDDAADEMTRPAEETELAGTLSERMIPTSFRVACVVHQEQLAISKWCELKSVSSILATARALVTRLRTQKCNHQLKHEGYKGALIDQDTRWSSKFKMIERLLQLKEFCKDHAHTELKGLRQDETFWKNLGFCKTLLEPLAELTNKLQDEQLTIPRFNEFWLTAELELADLIESMNWSPSTKLLELLKARRGKINENVLVLAGIYLDPRVRPSLTSIQACKAKEVIEAMFTRLVGHTSEETVMRPGTSSDTTDDEPPNKFGRFVGTLNAPRQRLMGSQSQASLNSRLLEYERDNFDQTVCDTTDPTKFWLAQRNHSDKITKTLSQVALKIITCPLTEVTSERMFSLLGFIVNKLRCNLKEDIIEDILFCKWNANALAKIVKK